MGAIFEPTEAHWDIWEDDGERESLRLSAAENEAGGSFVSIGGLTFGLAEVKDVEAALFNARLWLERVVKQRAELKAAEEVGQDADPACRCNRGLS